MNSETFNLLALERVAAWGEAWNNCSIPMTVFHKIKVIILKFLLLYNFELQVRCEAHKL